MATTDQPKSLWDCLAQLWRQKVAQGDRHARATRNIRIHQNKAPNHLLVSEPALSTQGIGGSCGQ
jgi:hypothetical protein